MFSDPLGLSSRSYEFIVHSGSHQKICILWLAVKCVQRESQLLSHTDTVIFLGFCPFRRSLGVALSLPEQPPEGWLTSEPLRSVLCDPPAATLVSAPEVLREGDVKKHGKSPRRSFLGHRFALTSFWERPCPGDGAGWTLQRSPAGGRALLQPPPCPNLARGRRAAQVFLSAGARSIFCQQQLSDCLNSLNTA